MCNNVIEEIGDTLTYTHIRRVQIPQIPHWVFSGLLSSFYVTRFFFHDLRLFPDHS